MYSASYTCELQLRVHAPCECHYCGYHKLQSLTHHSELFLICRFSMSCFQQLTRRSSLFQTQEMTRLRDHFKRNTYIVQQTKLLQGDQGNPTVALQNELEQLEKEFARLIEKHQELQQECAGRWRKVRSDALIYRKVCNSQRNGIGRFWKWLKSLFKRN